METSLPSVGERLTVPPLCIGKQGRIIASALAGQGSCETGDFWNITAEASIGESKKNEPVSVKRTIILYAIMICKGNLSRTFTASK